MSVPWNTEGISVQQCSWIPGGWQFSVWHRGGIDQGGADSEADAWEKARTIARFHGVRLASDEGQVDPHLRGS